MAKNIALTVLVLFIAVQYSGGLITLERRAPTAICKSLGPSYGAEQGSCSHAGGDLIRFIRR